jgi:hypothetical protein
MHETRGIWYEVSTARALCDGCSSACVARSIENAGGDYLVDKPMNASANPSSDRPEGFAEVEAVLKDGLIDWSIKASWETVDQAAEVLTSRILDHPSLVQARR